MDRAIDDIIGSAIEAYWEEEEDWFPGMIDDHHPEKGFHIQYYDGDEEWLATLAERKIRFEKDPSASNNVATPLQPDPIDDEEDRYMAKAQSNVSFNDAELEVVYEPQDNAQPEVDSSYIDVDNNRLDESPTQFGGGDDGDDYVDYDYNAHQAENKSTMCANLQLLPPRGVMLVGSVLGAEDLFNGDSNLRPSDGELLFKVLFVEGGNQPAMFRCKTPVFTSDPVHASSRPMWATSQFQLDMTMPEAEDTLQSIPKPKQKQQEQSYSMREYGFNIQGEVLIAVYQSRTTGGNNLVGQISFDLADVVKNGTAEFFLPGYEGRSVSGAQSLKSRSGGYSGEIEVHLAIGWKALFHRRRSSSSSPHNTKMQQELSSAVPRALSASTFATTTTGPAPRTPGTPGAAAGDGGASTSGTTNKLKSRTAGSKASTAAPGSKKGTKKGTVAAAPQRKIASKFQMQLAIDQKRIAAENKKMQKHLSTYATEKNKTPGVATLAGLSLAESKAKSRFDSKSIGTGAVLNYGSWEKPDQPGGGAGAESKAADTKKLNAMNDVAELFALMQQLHKDNAAAEAESLKLRQKLSKLNTNIKQCEMGISKRKPATTALDSSSNFGYNRNSDSNNKTIADAKGESSRIGGAGGGRVQYKSNTVNAAMAAASMRSTTGSVTGAAAGGDCIAEPKNTSNNSRTNSQQQQMQSKGGEDKENEGGATAQIFSGAIGPLSDAEMAALGITDGEYRSLAEEYNVLQSVRRGLIERIAHAKKSCDAASGEQDSAGEKLQLVRRRLSYYEDIAGDLVRLDGPHGPRQQQRQHRGGGGNSGRDYKGAGTRTTATTAAEPLSTRVENVEHDFLIFDRLRAAKADLLRDTLAHDSGMHTAAQDAGLDELQSVAAYLRGKCRELEEEAQTRHDVGQQQRNRLAEIIEGDLIYKKREFINKMRSLAESINRAERLQHIKDGQKTVELALLRLRLRRKEKVLQQQQQQPPQQQHSAQQERPSQMHEEPPQMQEPSQQPVEQLD